MSNITNNVKKNTMIPGLYSIALKQISVNTWHKTAKEMKNEIVSQVWINHVSKVMDELRK